MQQRSGDFKRSTRPLFTRLSLSHLLLFFDSFFLPSLFLYIYLILRLTHYNISVYLIHCPLQINLGFFCFLIKKKKKRRVPRVGEVGELERWRVSLLPRFRRALQAFWCRSIPSKRRSWS